MHSLGDLKKQFEAYLSGQTFPDTFDNLYGPANYIMSLGGKRIRPVLVLAAVEALGKPLNWAMNGAMSVEVFHNFSLVHDDIMDAADIRRGQATVHKKWDVNTAILSGDVMLVKAYDYLLEYNHDIVPELIRIFSKTAREVCEGQRMDMDFERRDDVTIEEYIQMITFKTGVLLGCALQLGAKIAGADEKDQRHFYEFGKNIGIAFQIQDDIIDTFGDSSKTGKKQGGDIVQNKKTYLYLKALQLLSEGEARRLYELYHTDDIVESEKISQVIDLFEKSFVKVHAEELKCGYRDLALSHLAALDLQNGKESTLLEMVNFLQDRAH
jgi:geranylgeranyl diphosphate synthase type II